ncbi:Mur ligase family protein [Cellulosimicrobium cellulans]|uniref:Mur ligase family protein n=1 Tax=Cellulosimicrobium cellulans TaxID=1710 RepID=UPI00130D4FD3|nr:Mur ligase family protein [Cellulosimicrobium cellulans]
MLRHRPRPATDPGPLPRPTPVLHRDAAAPARPPRRWPRRATTAAAVLLGRAARVVVRLLGGSGSALPGRVVARVFPTAAADLLAQLPRGVVLVTGSNGKTTTTWLISALLRGHGLDVVSNPTGSNLARGVTSALVSRARLTGRLDGDVAVLEVDEAHALAVAEQVGPTCVVLLNVVRDQLDRFAETDGVARLLGRAAARSTDAVVVNADDPHLHDLARTLEVPRVLTFGAGPALRDRVPVDALVGSPRTGGPPTPGGRATIELTCYDDDGRASIEGPGVGLTTRLALHGVHNAVNAAAAVAAARAVLGAEFAPATAAAGLSTSVPAFGRGELVRVEGRDLRIVLVKNPCGFRAALDAFAAECSEVLVAVNDAYADGRDASWLWDVDLRALRRVAPVHTAGTRAHDLALRLGYDGVGVADAITDVHAAVTAFVAGPAPADSGRPRLVLCTYTAMLQVRRALGAVHPVEDGLR